jgi:signal transduction histidine kinase
MGDVGSLSSATYQGGAPHFYRKLAAGFLLVSAVLGSIGLAAYGSLEEYEETASAITHTQAVLMRVQALLSNTLDAVTGLRGYLVTGQDRFLEPYYRSIELLPRSEADVLDLVRDSPEQMKRFNEIVPLIHEQVELMRAKLAVRKEGPYSATRIEQFMDRNKALMDSIRERLNNMEKAESELLTERESRAMDRARITRHTFVVGLILEFAILLWMANLIYRETMTRKLMQYQLQDAQQELEHRVQARTLDLMSANDHLRMLSRELIQTQEVERRRIARDLHDEIGQSLTAIKLNLRDSKNQLGNHSLTLNLVDSLQLLDQVIDQVRSLALDLRPSLLDELGLVPAVKWYLSRLAHRAGWQTEFVAGNDIKRLPGELEIACFRTAQEALTNVARHAKATRVSVTLLEEGNRLIMTIADNGKGFDVESARAGARAGGSMGLLGLEERARLVGGAAKIRSELKVGTQVEVAFPVAKTRMQMTPT